VSYKIEMLPAAEKELSNLSKVTKKRIDQHILELADDPRPHGVKKLKGSSKDLYRIVVGNYRIVYTIKDRALIILIVTIGHRREVYR
jgi:mRNA interferase RelE/StbE